MGGPIGTMTAPAKSTTTKTANKFEGLNEETKAAEAKPEPKGPPKFTGFKNFLSKQNEDNAEANKNLSDYQKKV